MNKIEQVFTPAVRHWVYRVLIALVAIFVGWRGWEAISTEQWTLLIEAILGIGVASGFGLADRNVPPLENGESVD